MQLNKNYLLFWVLIPFIIMAGLIFNKPIEILVHDTYFILSSTQISILISIIFFISGLGYFLYRKKGLNIKLTKAHIWLSISGLIVILILVLVQFLVNRNSQSAEFVEHKNIEHSIQIAIGQIIGLVFLGIGFLSYLLNMTITTINLKPK